MTPFPGTYFSISVDRQGPRAVVRVLGELDIATVPKLARTLDGLGPAARDVVIDLSEVWFMDLTAMRRLLRVQDRLAVRGGRLALAAVPDATLRMLRLTGLAGAFLLLDDPDETVLDLFG